jgi:hypothetical protein
LHERAHQLFRLQGSQFMVAPMVLLPVVSNVVASREPSDVAVRLAHCLIMVTHV